MCGIWFSAGTEPPRAVLDIIAHRGPDGSGWKRFDSPSGPVYLGHRRLAIIDRSDAGLQPMSDPSGRYWITYNGEIYNFVELRTELERTGYSFSSHTDSEVLLAAWITWGAACLDRFNGMFSFAIWDDRDKRLFAARDRFGIKPLYYHSPGKGQFCLASEIKQFTRLENFQVRANPLQAAAFLNAGRSDHGTATLFESVRQLPGGHYMDWQAGSPSLPEFRLWYSLPQGQTLRHLSDSAAAGQFADLLSDAIRLRLRADVPVGTCLSGGLDSSAIVCLLQDLLTDQHGSARAHQAAEAAFQDAQNSFSSCFDDPRCDERPYIDAVLNATGLPGHRCFPRLEDLVSELDDHLFSLDEPSAGISTFAQRCVFRLVAEKGVKVTLDGQGADEILGGYHTMFGPFHSGLVRRGAFLTAWREMKAQRRRHGGALIHQLYWLKSALLNRSEVVTGQTWLGPEGHALLASDQASSLNSGLARQAQRSLGDKCRADLMDTSLPQLLRHEDRNSMAFSVEARVPFLDYRLVEFAMALPDRHRIRDGETKVILRQALRDKLPPLIRDRQDKLGFPTPQEIWLASPTGKALLREGIAETDRRFPGLVDRAFLEAALDGKAELHPRNLWRAASLGFWARIFSLSL